MPSSTSPLDRLLRRFARLYGRLLFWRFLDGVYVRGLHRTRVLASQGPVLLAANHSCWWDGIFSVTIPDWLGVDGRFLVARESADGLGVIQTYGGIPVDRDRIADMTRAMEEAAAHLDRPHRAVLLFPQGRFRPSHLRPLGLQRGVRLLQRWSGATIVPVSISLGYRDNHLPTAVLTFGEPIEPGRRDVMEVLEQRLVQGLDEHTAWFDDLSRPPTFEPLIPSAIVPIERRPGALIWTGIQQVVGWLRRLLPGR